MLTLPGVYTPQHDTRLLASALLKEAGTGNGPPSDVLDIGTGSGALALCAARAGARVTAVDIAWRAVLTARVNTWLARQRITVLHGDLDTVLHGRTFDLVVSNPPYVPALRDGRGPARAWDAGRDGRAVLDRICAAAPAVLRPGGVLLLVHSALSGPRLTLERLAGAGLHAQVTERRRIPFGPVLRSRLDWLRTRGLLAPDEDREELVVIRAERR
ncbi:methyltransferase [Wenjunlia vitaminophila]|uniref:Methyltransferase n=1 Tax=Wenjunlia vitaminophila TaxID=76728 RepID=A0A0T6LSW2_WENVI|nr:methyltransferase [Wenjunlia vitaminophila]